MTIVKVAYVNGTKSYEVTGAGPSYVRRSNQICLWFEGVDASPSTPRDEKEHTVFIDKVIEIIR